jgi:hypothetical protein
MPMTSRVGTGPGLRNKKWAEGPFSLFIPRHTASDVHGRHRLANLRQGPGSFPGLRNQKAPAIPGAFRNEKLRLRGTIKPSLRFARRAGAAESANYIDISEIFNLPSGVYLPCKDNSGGTLLWVAASLVQKRMRARSCPHHHAARSKPLTVHDQRQRSATAGPRPSPPQSLPASAQAAGSGPLPRARSR